MHQCLIYSRLLSLNNDSHEIGRWISSKYNHNVEDEKMEDDIINQIMQIKEVTGVIQTNIVGDDIASNIKDEELSHFIKYLVGLMPLFERKSELGAISSVTLCNNKDNNIGIVIGEENSLGFLFKKGCSIKKLYSQINKNLNSIPVGDR